MTMTTCLHCNADTSNGLALCEMCQGRAAYALEWIPVYFACLARWQPGTVGARTVPGSRPPTGPPDGRGDRVWRLLDAVQADIHTWCRHLTVERGIPAPYVIDRDGTEQVATWCRMLARNLTSLAAGEYAGRLAVDLTRHERRLRALTETVAPGWYAGACRRCDTSTYVVPGLTWVTCRGCGATTYARDHLEVILKEARGWVAPPRRIAEALVALVDSEESVPRLHDRIRQWSVRGRVETVRAVDADGDPAGPKRFRLGDVLDRLQSDGPTGATRLHDCSGLDAS